MDENYLKQQLEKMVNQSPDYAAQGHAVALRIIEAAMHGTDRSASFIFTGFEKDVIDQSNRIVLAFTTISDGVAAKIKKDEEAKLKEDHGS